MEEQQNASTDSEILSALLDNEASEFEVHRALKLLDESADARALWQRYHRIAEGCRGERAVVNVDFSIDISSSVMARLDNEPVYDSGQASSNPSLDNGSAMDSAGGAAVLQDVKQSAMNRFLGSAAIAASVAVSVVFGAQFWGASPSSTSFQEPTVVNVNAADVQAPAGFNVPINARMASVGAELNQTPVNARTQTLVQQREPRRVIVVPAGASQAEIERRLNWLLLQHAEYAAVNGGGMMPYARVSRLPVQGVGGSSED